MDRYLQLRRAAGEKILQLEELLKERVPELDLTVNPQEFGESEKYSRIPNFIKNNIRYLKSQCNTVLPDYNKYILLKCLHTFSVDGGRYKLPASIVELYEREFSRILHQVDAFEGSFFDVGNDQYLKDLAIVSHRLIPVGAEFVEGGGGIPRRVIFAAGPRQLFRSLWFIVLRCGGFKPFFSLHTHTLALSDFDLEGWRATYCRLAELLELNPHVKGWLSSSWFLDPALESISPHLSHLHKVPVENGGMLLFVCSDPTGSSGALSRSPTRRRLFAEGKYVPAIYMRIWPRRALIDWHRRQT